MRPVFCYVYYFLCIIIYGCLTHVQASLEPTLIKGAALNKIGEGDNRLKLLNAFLVDPERGLDATLLQTSHDGMFIRNLQQGAEGRVVRFQISSGKTEYLTLKGSSGAWGGLPLGDEAYFGGHMGGFLFNLEEGNRDIQPISIPRKGDEIFEYIWSVDQGSDGNLYLGTYPDGALLKYEPESGQFTNLGTMVQGEKYLRNVNARFPGKVYCGIGSHAALIEYDIETGSKRDLLPEKYKDKSFVYMTQRHHDLLVAAVVPEDQLLFFDQESGTLLREVSIPEEDKSIWVTNYESLVTVGEDLYFGTMPHDQLYRYNYKRDELIRVGERVGHPSGLAGDRYLYCQDYFGTYRIFDVIEEKVVLERRTEFTGSGLQIHSLSEGSNGAILGSTYINQGFFSYNPSNEAFKRYGATVSFGGQIDELIEYGGKIYFGHYTKTRLSVYDPEKPWKPGTMAGSNPETIAQILDDQDRFSAVHGGEDGKIYFGTTPNYGVLGGALAIYDPEFQSFDVHRNLIPDQSVFALEGLNHGKLIGGTSISGGFGAHVNEESEAHIFIWDMKEKHLSFQMKPVAGAKEVSDLSLLEGGMVAGIADGTLFLFDPDSERILKTRKAYDESIIAIESHPTAEWCYGNTENHLFRFSPNLEHIEVIVERPGFWRGLLITEKGELYVGIGGDLYQYLPPDGHL